MPKSNKPSVDRQMRTPAILTQAEFDRDPDTSTEFDSTELTRPKIRELRSSWIILGNGKSGGQMARRHGLEEE